MCNVIAIRIIAPQFHFNTHFMSTETNFDSVETSFGVLFLPPVPTVYIAYMYLSIESLLSV